jgi:hypothetical protein
VQPATSLQKFRRTSCLDLQYVNLLLLPFVLLGPPHSNFVFSRSKNIWANCEAVYYVNFSLLRYLPSLTSTYVSVFTLAGMNYKARNLFVYGFSILFLFHIRATYFSVT